MNKSVATDLIHSVLDGEATPDEIRELDRLLVRDAAARMECAALRGLFDEFALVPQHQPPEDLQERILA